MSTACWCILLLITFSFLLSLFLNLFYLFLFRISHFIGFIFSCICFVTPVLFESNARMTELIQLFNGKGIIVIFGYIYFNSSVYSFVCLFVCWFVADLSSTVRVFGNVSRLLEWDCQQKTKSSKRWMQFVGFVWFGLVWFVVCVFSDII